MIWDARSNWRSGGMVHCVRNWTLDMPRWYIIGISAGTMAYLLVIPFPTSYLALMERRV